MKEIFGMIFCLRGGLRLKQLAALFVFLTPLMLNAEEKKIEDLKESEGGVPPDLYEMEIEAFQKNENKVLEASDTASSLDFLTSFTYQCSHNIFNDNCTNSPKVVCSWDMTKKLFRLTINITNLSTIRVWTDQLLCLDDYVSEYDYCCPDTVVYLIRESDKTIVGIDDDGNNANYPLASFLQYTPTQTGQHTIIVASYYTNRAGIADVWIEYNGNPAVKYAGQTFGGHHVLNKSVKSGDVMLVGKNNNGLGLPSNPEYHDTTLFNFSTSSVSCYTGNCGKYEFNDDAWGMLLSRLDIQNASGGARAIVGVYNQHPYYSNTRFFHVRRHRDDGGAWDSNNQKDGDGDGLTYEIENELGTCDYLSGGAPGTDVGIQGMSCLEFSTYVNNNIENEVNNGNYCDLSSQWRCKDFNSGNKPPSVCWHACDSDNDGIRDDIEIWGVRSGCEKPPVSPYYDPGRCVQLPLIGESYGTVFYSLPVSSLDNPYPKRLDSFVEVDHLYLSDIGNDTSLTQNQVNQIKQIYGERGKLCWDGTQPNHQAPFCPNSAGQDRPYEIRMHIYQDDSIAFPYRPSDALKIVSLLGGVVQTCSYFNFGTTSKGFTPTRKFTNIFRYAMAYWDGGGQAFGAQDKPFIFGNYVPKPLRNANVFAHEHGHTLALSDHNEPRHPAFHSIMNYKYMWSGFTPMQDGFGVCNEVPARFSKGLNNLLFGTHAVNEASFSEVYGSDTWIRRKLPYEVDCISELYPVTSQGGHNCIDWNGNSVFCEAGPLQHDIDKGDSSGDGINNNDLIKDKNDWERMITWGRKTFRDDDPGYSLMRYIKFAVYQDGYNNSNTFNFAGWTFPIYKSATFEDAVFRINHCVSASNCNNQSIGCKNDTCFIDSNCKISCDLTYNLCRCASDSDCFSGWCDESVGICENWDQGTCRCNTQADCHQGTQCTFEGSSNERTCGTQGQYYGKAIKFRGSGYGDYLRLSSSGSGNPVNVIHTGDYFYAIDFRFNGFSAGQTEQYLLDSGHLDILIKKTASGNVLWFQLNGAPNVLEYPSRWTGNYIKKNHWYRLYIGFIKQTGRLYLYVYKEKELGTGLYSELEGCTYKDLSSFSLTAADIVFGYSSDNTKRFNGTLDNINLFHNYHEVGLDTNKCSSQ